MSMRYKNYLFILFLFFFLLIFIGLIIQVSSFVTELQQVKQELAGNKVLISSLQKEIEILKEVKIVASINTRTVANYFILAVVGTFIGYYTYILISTYRFGSVPDFSESVTLIPNPADVSCGSIVDIVLKPVNSEEVVRVFKNTYLISEEVVNLINNFKPKVIQKASIHDVDFFSEFYTSITYSEGSQSVVPFIDAFSTSL